MSEAIENMDSLKTNLDSLNESINAARQIEKVYDQYNQIVLYDKALMLTEALKNLEDCEKNRKGALRESYEQGGAFDSGEAAL
mgnify:CR=1 FL=1